MPLWPILSSLTLNADIKTAEKISLYSVIGKLCLRFQGKGSGINNFAVIW